MTVHPTVPGDRPIAPVRANLIRGYPGLVPADFTLIDQSGTPWTLSDHLDAAAMLVFLRGDW
jgi:hypothetical protein